MVKQRLSIMMIAIIIALLSSTTHSQSNTPPVFNMLPAPDSLTELTQGDPLVITVDVYIAGITDNGLSGAVVCSVLWRSANAEATIIPMMPMSDNEDGVSDRHQAVIGTDDLATGYYTFTTACDYGTNRYLYEDYHLAAYGRFSVSSPIAPATPIFRMRPEPASLTIQAPADPNLLIVSVDSYLLGVTDRAGAGSDVLCYVWADFADGLADEQFADILMQYDSDSMGGLADRHVVSIDVSALAEGDYRFTTRCDHDGSQYWFNQYNPEAGGDAHLIISNDDPAVILSRPEVIEGIDWVGELTPMGGIAQVFPPNPQGTVVYTVAVDEAGVTEMDGQGADIACYLTWGLFDEESLAMPMTYTRDDNNRDIYAAELDISGWDAGNYAIDAYCTLGDGTRNDTQRRWTVDQDEQPYNEGVNIISVLPLATPPPQTVFVHLFEWRWSDISAECPYLAQVGYDAVQVSPPQEHIILEDVATDPWWTRYQPVSYQLEGRSGTREEFQQMIDNCTAVGVEIYVDAVINHMSGQNSPTQPGTADTVYGHYDYPGLYTADDFSTCQRDINNYRRRSEVQGCELLNLADLDTGSATVRAAIQSYLQGLIDMGVAGFRIDAAKHMPAHDLTAILSALTGDPYIYQEVIGADGEPILPAEYIINGDVTEFSYSRALGNAFNCTNLTGLQTFARDFIRSRDAIVFVDNHDNQRSSGGDGRCILDHRDGRARYTLGNIFMLAHPYGYPRVMSSYWWDDGTATAKDNPPPSNPVYQDGAVVGCNDRDWVCEHRYPAITQMIGFRRVTANTEITHWQTGNEQQIAFGRGEVGFVAINNDLEAAWENTTFETALRPGTYCDLISGGFDEETETCLGLSVTVNADGTIDSVHLDPLNAFAIHVPPISDSP